MSRRVTFRDEDLTRAVKAVLAAGAEVELALVGCFELAKVSTDTFAVGAAAYWNDTTMLITSTAAGNAKVGACVQAAGSGAATVRVRLNGVTIG